MTACAPWSSRGRRGRHRLQRHPARFARHYGYPAQGLPARIGPRPRARSSARSAMSGRTSSLAGASAISTTSMPSSGTGSTRSPTGAPRHHAAGRRGHFAEEQPKLLALPAGPFQAVLRLERRITRDGMVSVGGNLYSVPDATRRRMVEVQARAGEVRIFEEDQVIACHPVLDGRGQRRIAPGIAACRRRQQPDAAEGAARIRRPGESVARVRSPSTTPWAAASPPRSTAMKGEALAEAPLERIRATWSGCACRARWRSLDHIVLQQIERGQLGASRRSRRCSPRNSPSARGGGSRRRCRWLADPGQDAGRLRLRLPALARPQPHPRACRARLHRPPRGGAPDRPARHRQEPPRHRARGRGGARRALRLLRPARRYHRQPRPGRARRAAARAHPLSSAARSC